MTFSPRLSPFLLLALALGAFAGCSDDDGPTIPNVVMVPIADAGATWDLFVVWQRGKVAGPLRTLIDALTTKPGNVREGLNP